MSSGTNVWPGTPARWLTRMAAVALAVCLLAACSSSKKSESTGGTSDFNIVVSNNGTQWTPINAMISDGVAAKHHLKLKLTVFQNGSGSSSQIFTGGTGDLLMAGIDAPVNFVLKKTLAVTVVGAIENHNPFVLAAKAGASFNDVMSLKGKVIGVSGAGSFSDYSLRSLVASSGMTPSDVKVAAFGAGPTQLAALSSNHASAVMLQSPAYEDQLAAGKIKTVHNFRLDAPTPAIVAIARSKDVKAKPQVFSDFLAAWKDELAKMKADPAYATQAAVTYLGNTTTPADAKVQIDSFLGGIWSLDGVFDQPLYDGGKAVLVGSGVFPAGTYPTYQQLTNGFTPSGGGS
jgi:ABC-type nitrate/sulfonate/bicarbonate transport system substrate-binding protein